MKSYFLAVAVVFAASLFLLGCTDVDEKKLCANSSIANITSCGLFGWEGQLVVLANKSDGFEFNTLDGDVIKCNWSITNSTSTDCKDLVESITKDEYCSDENACDEYMVTSANTTTPGRTSAPPK